VGKQKIVGQKKKETVTPVKEGREDFDRDKGGEVGPQKTKNAGMT